MEALHQSFWFWHSRVLSLPVVLTVVVGLLVWRGRDYTRRGLPVRSLLLKQSLLWALLFLGFQVLHQAVRHNSRDFLCCLRGGCSCHTEHVWILFLSLALAFWAKEPAPASSLRDDPGASVSALPSSPGEGDS